MRHDLPGLQPKRRSAALRRGTGRQRRARCAAVPAGAFRALLMVV
jgi:hypothetical protein